MGWLTDALPGVQVEIIVRWEGPGISAEVLENPSSAAMRGPVRLNQDLTVTNLGVQAGPRRCIIYDSIRFLGLRME